MRKINAFDVTTLDGYYEGPNHEFDWPLVDDEFNDFALAQLQECDTLLFGRVTYEGMASYWPTEMAQHDDPRVAAVMNSIPKIVVSRTLDTADWARTRIVRDVAELRGLKEQPGKNITIFGSFALTVDLLQAGLVDELGIMVNPILLGAGFSLFHTAAERIPLELVRSRQFRSGTVLLTYRPR